MKRLLELIFLPIRLLWAAPCSALGLSLALLAVLSGGRMRLQGGALEAWFGRGRLATALGRQRFAAITLGHVIVAIRRQDLRRWHAHERVHVWQFEMLGALMLIAYPAASLWAWVCGQEAYMGNVFELQAYRAQPSSELDSKQHSLLNT